MTIISSWTRSMDECCVELNCYWYHSSPKNKTLLLNDDAWEVNARFSPWKYKVPTSSLSPSTVYLLYYLFHYYYLDDLVSEKERYKDIGDDLDIAFVELILKE